MTVSFAQVPSASVVKPQAGQDGKWRQTETVSKGVKKAKSMAFNSTGKRFESGSKSLVPDSSVKEASISKMGY